MTLFRGRKKTDSGLQSVENAPISGRPKRATAKENVVSLRKMLAIFSVI